MQVTLELPDELAEQIRGTSGDVARRLLEGFAAQSYSSGALSSRQVQQLLGFKDRFELDAFLKQSGVGREYTAEELSLDYDASHRASSEHSQRS